MLSRLPQLRNYSIAQGAERAFQLLTIPEKVRGFAEPGSFKPERRQSMFIQIHRIVSCRIDRFDIRNCQIFSVDWRCVRVKEGRKGGVLISYKTRILDSRLPV